MVEVSWSHLMELTGEHRDGDKRAKAGAGCMGACLSLATDSTFWCHHSCYSITPCPKIEKRYNGDKTAVKQKINYKYILVCLLSLKKAIQPKCCLFFPLPSHTCSSLVPNFSGRRLIDKSLLLFIFTTSSEMQTKLKMSVSVNSCMGTVVRARRL